MPEPVPAETAEVGQSRVTSLPLTTPAVAACWSFAVALLGAGIAATFLDKSGAPSATLIALGALLLILALMKRIPLRMEVAGTKIDASYPPDQAYDAGRDGGVVEGLDTAIETVEQSHAAGADWDELIELLRRTRQLELPAPPPTSESAAELSDASEERAVPSEDVGWRGPTACNAAGITYRQLDYWARTGLVEPSVRGARGTGAQRLYSFTDIVLLTLTRRLLDAGVSLQQIRTAVQHVREYPQDRWTTITLMSDGHSVYEVTNEDELFDLLGSGRGMFGISLKSLVAEVGASLAELPSEPTD